MEEDLHRLGECFDVLGNTVRLKILFLLEDDEKSVSTIVSELNRSSQSISRHLKIMRLDDLLQSHTEGRERLYKIKRPELLELCKQFRNHFNRTD